MTSSGLALTCSGSRRSGHASIKRIVSKICGRRGARVEAVPAPSAELRTIRQNAAPASRQPVALGRRVDPPPPCVTAAAKTSDRAGRAPGSRRRRRPADLVWRHRTTATLLRRHLLQVLSLPQGAQQLIRLIARRAVDMWTTLKERCSPAHSINANTTCHREIADPARLVSPSNHPQILPRRQLRILASGYETTAISLAS
jgi:hypothetical protein